jgi:transcriptional regulator with XRE-family HTH domain
MGATWGDGPPIEPSEVKELIDLMGMSQTEFAEVLEVTQQHVNRMVNGKSPIVRGSTRVLLRWRFSVYGIEGGRPPTPIIPVRRVQGASAG